MRNAAGAVVAIFLQDNFARATKRSGAWMSTLRLQSRNEPGGGSAILPTPAWAVRLAFGELGREALLASARAVPSALLRTGFDFQPGGLAGALRRMLG